MSSDISATLDMISLLYKREESINKIIEEINKAGPPPSPPGGPPPPPPSSKQKGAPSKKAAPPQSSSLDTKEYWSLLTDMNRCSQGGITCGCKDAPSHDQLCNLLNRFCATTSENSGDKTYDRNHNKWCKKLTEDWEQPIKDDDDDDEFGDDTSAPTPKPKPAPKPAAPGSTKPAAAKPMAKPVPVTPTPTAAKPKLVKQPAQANLKSSPQTQPSEPKPAAPKKSSTTFQGLIGKFASLGQKKPQTKGPPPQISIPKSTPPPPPPRGTEPPNKPPPPPPPRGGSINSNQYVTYKYRN